MENRPDGFSDTALLTGLARYYGIEAADVKYLPVGFGDYHWTVTGDDGIPWFVKVSDLTNKPQCGSTPPSVLDGLRNAMGTASTLRDDAGLRFVVAPERSRDGEPVVSLDERWALGVFAHIEAETFDFYTEISDARRDEVLDLLARLHTVTPPRMTPTYTPGVRGRETIDAALADLASPWSGGPFAEPAREAAIADAPTIRARLTDMDDLVEQVQQRDRALVVTHGEPHPGNLLRHADNYLLIDWDTVGLAVPERDLAVLSGDPSALARYSELTGTEPDPAALALYGLRWSLTDLAEFLAWFRGPHRHDSDTEMAWQGLRDTLAALGTWHRPSAAG